MEPARDLVGQQIDGRYRMVELLGRGGMGAVYRAQRIGTDQVVAVKVLHEYINDPSARPRFLREARLAARIEHPGVVRVLDFGRWGEERENHYLSMELLECLSMAQLLMADLPTPVCAGLIWQVLDALAHVHAREVLHRDIKPENLLVARDLDGALVVKIADFGIAAAVGSDPSTRLTDSRVVLGTPNFMAPEQAMGQTLHGPGIDLYPLGVLLFRLLTGRMPFEGSPMAVMVAKTRRDPEWPVDGRGTDTPEALRSVVLKLLARKPENRFAVAADAKAALRPFCAPAWVSDDVWGALGGPMEDRPPSPPTRPVEQQPTWLNTAVSGPFWGRENELHQLDSVAREVEAGRGRAVLVHGAAGVGKTSLLRTFSLRMAEEGRFTLLRYQCVDNGGNFVEGLDRFLGTLGRPRDEVVVAAREFLSRHGDEDETEVQRLVELIRPTSEAPIDPKAAYALATRVVRRLARHRPVLVLIDDAALSGASSISWVAYLLFEAAYEPFPVFVGVTWRDSDSTPLFERALARSDRFEGSARLTWHLEPLAQGTLMQGLHEAGDIPRKEAAALATRAGGNPLYAKLLMEAHSEGTEIPPRLRGLLEANQKTRLSRARVPDRARRLLEIIALLGSRVELDLLTTFMQGDPREADVEEDLDDLVELALVLEPAHGDESVLVFPHGLHREVILETTLPRRARRLHQRAAEALRTWGDARSRSVGARVAHHLEAAGDDAAVADAWLDAAEQERAGGEAGRAVELYGRALQTLRPTDPRVPRAQLMLGNILAEAGAADRARPMLEALLEGPHALPAGEALAGLLEVQGEGLALARLLSRLAPLAKTASPSRRRAYQRLRAGWLSSAGRYKQAITESTEALEGARPGREAVLAANQLAFAHRLAGQPELALQAAQVAVQNARDDDDRARATRAKGLVFMWTGDGPRARRDLEEAAELLRHSGRTLLLSRVVLDLATLDLVERDWSTARTTLLDAERTAAAAGDAWSEQAAAFRRIYADLLDGRVDGVRERLDELLPRAAATGLRFFLESQAPLRCWLDIAEGRLAAGFDHLASIPRLDT
jgi:eukaryotic-like serine/threonine-protein kinase